MNIPTNARPSTRILKDLLKVRRELIKISENIIDTAKLNDININGKSIIENSEKILYDLAEKGSFNSNIIKFDEAVRQTIDMASNASCVTFYPVRPAL